VRKWRFDYAWPSEKLAVEVEGGIYIHGRHTRGSGFEKDLEKYAEALRLGWRVLRVSGRMINAGTVVEIVEELLRRPADG
jgi:very-short-patch-repair endonuclease